MVNMLLDSKQLCQTVVSLEIFDSSFRNTFPRQFGHWWVLKVYSEGEARAVSPLVSDETGGIFYEAAVTPALGKAVCSVVFGAPHSANAYWPSGRGHNQTSSLSRFLNKVTN